MKKGTPRHPKTYNLADRLKVPLYAAAGILEMLWHVAGQQTPQGDIGSLSDAAIAEGVAWKKSPVALVEALAESRWFDRSKDHRFILHDWPDHCEESVIKKLIREEKDFLPCYGKTVHQTRSGRSRDINQTPSRQKLDGIQPSREAMAMATAEAQKFGGGAGGTEMHWSVDEGYQPFVAAYRQARPNTLDDEFADAIFPWRMLDFEQQLKAVRGVVQRVQYGIWRPGEPHMITPPVKYLQREWKREVIAPARAKLETGAEYIERMARGDA